MGTGAGSPPPPPAGGEAPGRPSAQLALPVSLRPHAKMAPRARRPRWKSNADSSMGSALALWRCFRGKSGCLSAESSMLGAEAPAAGGPGRGGTGRDGAAATTFAARPEPRRAASPVQPCVCGSAGPDAGCRARRAQPLGWVAQRLWPPWRPCPGGCRPAGAAR